MVKSLFSENGGHYQPLLKPLFDYIFIKPLITLHVTVFHCQLFSLICQEHLTKIKLISGFLEESYFCRPSEIK